MCSMYFHHHSSTPCKDPSCSTLQTNAQEVAYLLQGVEVADYSAFSEAAIIINISSLEI
jgi:hypothetical protein